MKKWFKKMKLYLWNSKILLVLENVWTSPIEAVWKPSWDFFAKVPLILLCFIGITKIGTTWCSDKGGGITPTHLSHHVDFWSNPCLDFNSSSSFDIFDLRVSSIFDFAIFNFSNSISFSRYFVQPADLGNCPKLRFSVFSVWVDL